MAHMTGILKRVASRFGLWFHWQNLNEKPTPRGEEQRVGWPRKGRCWLSRSEWDDHDRRTGKSPWCLGVEWVFPSCRFGFGIDAHTERDEAFTLRFAVPPFDIYVNIESGFARKLARRLIGKAGERELDISIHSGALRWNFWTPGMEWSSKTPKWRNGSFHPVDFFLGSRRYSKTPLESGEIEIPMPEATYTGTYELSVARWKRPRWPFARTIRRGEANIPEGIPFPGKGENAWDCGQDRTYGITCSARTKAELIGETVKSVARDRERNGSGLRDVG